jgi:hypothetical protein
MGKKRKEEEINKMNRKRIRIKESQREEEKGVELE